jgi:uncharacterized protein YheU (UPF0270 family)
MQDGVTNIPYELLSEEVLSNLIEEFVTRDGTEMSDADDKVEQVLKLLQRGSMKIVFDEESESCNMITADQLSKGEPKSPDSSETH